MKRALIILAVGLFVAGCLAAGVWQLSRLGDKRAFNATLVARSEMPVVDVAVALGEGTERAAYRRVTARGSYDTTREVILLSRSYRGISGHHVVTPLVLDDGRVLLVDRGWVPLIYDEPPVAEAAPPAGRVTVEGVLQPSVERGRFGPRATTEGPHEQVFRIDLDALAPQFDGLLSLWLHLTEQAPAQPGELPTLVAPPGLDEGPHLAYAIQWFLFAVAATVTATAVARRRRPSRSPSRS